MRQRISVATLAVEDLERSRRFYCEGLGLSERPESSDRAVFIEMEKSWLALFPRDRLARLAGVSPEHAGFTGVVLSDSVATADEVMDLAVKAGATVTAPVEDGSFGCIGYFADPDGHMWEVAYTPKWPELTQ